MGTLMSGSPSETVRLTERLHAGQPDALAGLFDHYRDRLLRMVDLGDLLETLLAPAANAVD